MKLSLERLFAWKEIMARFVAALGFARRGARKPNRRDRRLARRSRGNRPTSRSDLPLHRLAGFEFLEPRLDVCSFWFNSGTGLLSVAFGDEDDSQGSSIGVWNGVLSFATVNGESENSDGQWVDASTVQTIAIELGTGFGQTGSSSNNLDLEGTTDPAFSSLSALDLIIELDPNGSGASPVINYVGPLQINLSYVLNGGTGDNALTGSSSIMARRSIRPATAQIWSRLRASQTARLKTY
jgi:hypothetical protein